MIKKYRIIHYTKTDVLRSASDTTYVCEILDKCTPLSHKCNFVYLYKREKIGDQKKHQ